MSTRNAYRPAATPAPLARKRAALMVSAAAIALIALPGSVAFAQTAGTPGPNVLPQDPTVVAGGAGFSTTGANLNVTQGTDRVVIDWRSFDIGSNAAVNFYQPDTTSIAVNRVSGGGMPSQIHGALTANGVVVVLNPNGVLFSASSRVDVGGLVASTGQMNVDRFMAGDQRLEFTGATGGAIVTSGQINIAGAGLGAFVAPSVRNDGVINARLGRVALAAGETFTLDLAGDRLIELGLGANTPLVENYGSILADGGRVQLSALAAGVVVDQVINAGGHISVSSAHQDGGTIVLEGESVTVSGTLDASGATGGGDIRALADHLTLTADARLDAAATVAGDGGFIETSGYQTASIADGATVSAAGAGGAAGTWLIDPLNLTIISGADDGIVSGSTVTAGTIEASLGGGTNVSLTTNQSGSDDGDLTVAGSINATSTGGASLILTGRRIQATGGSTISIAGGNLTLNVNAVNTLADTTVSGNWIQDALNVVGTVSGNVGINLGAGTYRAGSLISHDRVTLDGQGVARIDASHNGDDGVTVTGDYVTVQNLEIFGDADQSYITFGWPTTTRGVVLRNGAENATITGNNIHDVRNGVLVDGRNTGSAVTDNTIENTKSAISVQYTDGSNIILTGNREGVFGNEWGINVHLNGILQTNGTITPSAGALGANTTLVEQARLLAMSTANNGMSIQNQAWTAANRTHAHVSTTGGASNQGSARSTLNTVQGGVNAVVNGGTVYVADGTYNWGSTALLINKSLTLLGQSQTGTIFDGRGIGSGLGTMQVQADNVTLGNFTLYGADNGVNNYGIKVQPLASGYNVNQRLYNFAISDVTVRGSTRAELDLNGVVGATITNFTADGRRVSDDNFQSGGAGIQITDSSGITLTGVHTLGNAWGGVALYQSNRAGAYNGQTTNINIDASQNQFDEGLGLFTQLESSIHTFGQLNLTGFNYAVRNTGHRADGSQFTFFRTSLGDATAFALGISAPTTSSIEGYSGTDFTNVFTVVDGLAIGSAVRDARTGGTINVGAGTYGTFGTSFGGAANVSILGSAGAIIDGSGVTGRIVDLRADGTIFSGFTIVGDGTGVAVSVSGRGVTVSGNTITDVLTGVQTTTQYAAGNAVISGNTISADYGVSLQNTGNTVSGNTVNAAIEGVGLLQGSNSFSGNTFTMGAGGDALKFYGTATATQLTSSDNTVTIAGGSLQGAVDLAGGYGTVNVGAGTYSGLVSISKALTLAGAGMDATFLTGGIKLNGSFDDIVFRDFTVSGDGGSNAIVRGGNFHNNLTVDGVRFDGGGVAGRYGFASGKYGGAISITNSEFVNIRGWSAFDTSTGGTATPITSVVFSNNLLDNTVGHITFRQATPTANVLISNNTVRNVGDTTDLSSGIFKVFGGATVDFVDNNISGIGASPTRFTAGVADGAALIVNNVGTLNLTNNVFTDNQQALLVGAGNALPAVMNLTGNTFDNNAYAIFLPASTGGTVNFGAGNAFISGASTQQHIVRVASGTMDLTNVLFDGKLGSAMTNAELFALEDRLTHGTDVAGAGLALVKADNVYVTTASGSIQRGIDAAGTGYTVNLDSGIFTLPSTLNVNKAIALIGAGRDATVINAAASGYGISVSTGGVELANFTLNGPSANAGSSYGIKVSPGGPRTSVLDGFTITNVTVRGSGRAELDLNGVRNAVIDGFIADGQGTAGAGIQVTDSSGVTIRNSTTVDNAWGGVALYLANRSYDLQLGDILIAASNDFQEANGLFYQGYSPIHANPGLLTIEGYSHIVQNSTYRAAEGDWIYFQRSLEGALDFAVNLSPLDIASSVVRGWTGTDGDGNFTVGIGNLAGGGTQALSIGAAANAAQSGDTVRVLAGTYSGFGTAFGGASDLNVLTTDGAVIDGSGVTGRIVDLRADGTTFSGFTITGDGGGVGVSISGRGVTASDNTISNVLTGVQTTTQYAAGDAIISGNTISANHGISLQNTGNAVSGNIVNAAIEGVGLLQGENSFSGNTFTIGAGGDALNLYGSALAADMTGGDNIVTIAGGGLQGAVDLALDNGTVNVGDGTYAEDVLVSTVRTLRFGAVSVDGLTLAAGAAGSGVSGDVTSTGDLAFAGDVTLLGDLSLTAAGSADVAGVTGSGHNLNLAGASVSLGSTGDLNGLDITGATTLTGGSYTADRVTITGATTLTRDTTIGGSSITLGSVSGAHSLGLTGTGAVALGAADLASLTASGATIGTAGVITSGAQSYTGATTLNGAYTGTGFTVVGATTLGGATTIGGSSITLGTVDGPQALTINGATGTVRLGALGSTTALASANVSGGSLNLANARTTGAQTYTGATISASGQYTTAGGAYTLAGSTTLGGATTVSTQGGAVTTGDVNGSAAGAQSLNIDAGTGATSLGALGSSVRLGAVLVRANTTVLNGATYAGNSLAFEGTGTNANVRLTRAMTTFNSTAGASAGTISISPNLIGTTARAQSVAFIAGDGAGADSSNGDITLGNLGSDAIRLGSMSVTGSDLTARTVKLAGDYSSVLTGNQTFSAQTLDTLGNANMRVAGNDTGPIVAGGSVTIVSGGATTGSLTAAGPVNVTSTGNSDRVISSGGATSVASQGTISGSVVSSGPVVLTATGPIVSSVTTPGAVSITSNGTVTVNVQAGSVNLTAPGGSIGGTFGTISTGAGGTFNVNGEVVVGDGTAADRQILVDSFLAPAGGLVGSTGQIQLPVNFALALIAPAGDGSGAARQPIIVNSIDRLGELLRLGYTAIIIQIDGNEAYEQELNLAAEDTGQPQA